MTDTREQLAQAIQALKNSYSDDFGYSELLTEDVVIAWSACTPRQLDAEVVARVQREIADYKTRSRATGHIPYGPALVTLRLFDVKAMLVALQLRNL